MAENPIFPTLAISAEAVVTAAAPHGEVFDPSKHTIEDVNAYIGEHPDVAELVHAAEAAGKARKGILDGPHFQPPA